MKPDLAEKLLRPTVDDPVRVKICGLTNPADTSMAIDAGADALGFNFFPGSKRFLDLAKERHWLENVPDHVLRVGVVVDPGLTEAISLLAEPWLDALQLHGGETPEFCRALLAAQPKPIIKALRVRDANSVSQIREYAFLPVLLDAFAAGEFGGTGQTFDWNLLSGLQKSTSLLLSGGLNPGNAASAVRLTNLRFLDVASGVETHPREKSREKVTAFLQSVRNL